MNSNTTNNNNNITLLCRLHLFVVSKSPKPTIPQNLPNPRYLKISQIHNASCHSWYCCLWWVRELQVGFIMFQPMVEKLLKIWKFFTKTPFKPKPRNYRGILVHSWFCLESLLGVEFLRGDFIICKPKVGGRYWIFKYFLSL
jgi:hypothetical protein